MLLEKLADNAGAIRRFVARRPSWKASRSSRAQPRTAPAVNPDTRYRWNTR
jgi:hypothetical protein